MFHISGFLLFLVVLCLCQKEHTIYDLENRVNELESDDDYYSEYDYSDCDDYEYL